MFALVDCNNFYASCERLFKPALANQPVIVLSNNDGCVIARSNEARALGIKMGEPYFKIKELCRRHRVAIFSSNFALYGDLSQRIRTLLQQAWPDVEVYSIDEAFLDLKTMPPHKRLAFCDDLQRQVKKATGIPVSIGLGETKTLAKLGNYLAKRHLFTPVFELSPDSHHLAQLPVDEVWGIGRRYARRLQGYGIQTVKELVQSDRHLMRKRFNVNLERTILELRGVRCLSLEVSEPKKSITTSRSFGQMLTSPQKLASALSLFVARASEKLRAEQLQTQMISIFLYSNRHRHELPQANTLRSQQLLVPTDDTRVLTKVALSLLEQAYQTGIHYKKAGVLLECLTPSSIQQQTLFIDSSPSPLLMPTFDAINQRYGRDTVHLAVSQHRSQTLMRQMKKSPSYTTNWKALPLVKA